MHLIDALPINARCRADDITQMDEAIFLSTCFGRRQANDAPPRDGAPNGNCASSSRSNRCVKQESGVPKELAEHAATTKGFVENTELSWNFTKTTTCGEI